MARRPKNNNNDPFADFKIDLYLQGSPENLKQFSRKFDKFFADASDIKVDQTEYEIINNELELHLHAFVGVEKGTTYHGLYPFDENGFDTWLNHLLEEFSLTLQKGLYIGYITRYVIDLGYSPDDFFDCWHPVREIDWVRNT